MEERDYHVEIVTQYGGPQGFSISSALFLIVIDNLLYALQLLGRLHSQAFADVLSFGSWGFSEMGLFILHFAMGYGGWSAGRDFGASDLAGQNVNASSSIGRQLQ